MVCLIVSSAMERKSGQTAGAWLAMGGSVFSAEWPMLSLTGETTLCGDVEG